LKLGHHADGHALPAMRWERWVPHVREVGDGKWGPCVSKKAARKETPHVRLLVMSLLGNCWSTITIDAKSGLEEEAKRQSTHNFFMEFFIIACWTIWKQRNGFIFIQGQPSLSGWKRKFCNEAYIQSTRMKPDLCSVFLSLVDMYR
jgi:hypothetical protein